MKQQITIVGAGLVGSLLASMLGHRGFQVRVLEKRPNMRESAISAGRSINLALAERGIHALRTADLYDEVEPLLIPMRGRMLHDIDGSVEFMPYGQRPAEVIYSISRGALNQLMMTAAESSGQVTIFFDHKVESIDFVNNEITIHDRMRDQRLTWNYEVLIGADGAGSRIRRLMLPAAGGVDNSQLLDHDYKELTIPAGAGGVHQLDRNALHIWPRGGYMLIALPNLDGSFTVTLFLPKTGDPSFVSLQCAGDVDRFFEHQFPDARRLIPRLADEFFQHPTGILGTVRCRPWSYLGNVLLIGDAAHAVVPFHGQGMNAGFEDCEILLDALNSHGGNIREAIAEFAAQRMRDTDAIAEMALENYIVMRDSVTEPAFQLKKELGFLLEREFPDRFIPRYSMVMFHGIPYSEVFRRGKIQAEILDQLVDGKRSIDDIDLGLARSLIRMRLSRIAHPAKARKRGAPR
jgi:kynurenine 3-monooxygenase